MKRKVEYFEIKAECRKDGSTYLVVWIGRTHLKYHNRCNDQNIYFPESRLLPRLQRIQKEFLKGKLK